MDTDWARPTVPFSQQWPQSTSSQQWPQSTSSQQRPQSTSMATVHINGHSPHQVNNGHSPHQVNNGHSPHQVKKLSHSTDSLPDLVSILAESVHRLSHADALHFIGLVLVCLVSVRQSAQQCQLIDPTDALAPVQGPSDSKETPTQTPLHLLLLALSLTFVNN